MADIHSLARPVPGVSVAMWRDGKVLLTQRGKPPFIGTWSFPGGRVKTGEHLEEAAKRELLEETGLEAKGLVFVRPVEIILHQDDRISHHIVLSLFTCRWGGGEALAATDAKALRWVELDEIQTLSVTEGLEKYARACWDTLQKDGT